MKIDNFDKIPSLCDFQDGSYYKFFLIIRKKDVGEHPLITSKSQENLIKFWLIDSKEYFEKKKSEMLFLLEAIPISRLYMVLDAKSSTKTFITARENIQKVLDEFVLGNKQSHSVRYLNRFLSSSTSSPDSNTKQMKKYLFDIDTMMPETVMMVEEFLRQKNITKYELLKSLNGYHLVCDRSFNMMDFQSTDVVELKKDASVLIAMS